MTQKEVIVLYHAYGAVSLHQQVLFSILTLHYHLKGNYEGIQVVVYTDHKEHYKDLATKIPVSFQLLDKERITTYKGDLQFVHRVKIAVIKDCFQQYRKNILYLDSDTYFTTCPRALFQKIDAETSIMNSDDYDLNNADELYENEDWLMIRRAIRDFEYVIEGKKLKIPLSTRMWNAGVIGLSFDNSKILDDVMNLTDQIYNNRKVFTAEQFAFSYFLQTKTNLISSGEVIFHYWPNFPGKYWKNLYSYHFKSFFKKHKNTGLDDKAFQAYKLTTNHESITKSISKSKFDRIFGRFKLAYKAFVKGKI